MSAIEFTHATIGYDDHPVIRDVSFTIADGDLALVVGRTGAGKSTLLGALNGLVPHFTGGNVVGDVRVAGRSIRDHRPRDLADIVGFVHQNPQLGFVTDRVEDEVAYGMEQLGLTPSAMRKRVEETLDLMSIADLRRRPLTSLSGGQQQRVAIAAVLAAGPRILVLDEPTSALDPTAAQDVFSAITSLVHDVGLTVVLAEHRLERVMADADTVMWLPGDGSVDVGPASQVLARSDVTPPLAAIAHALDWPEVPLSVRDARRRVAREQLDIRSRPNRTEPVTGDVVASVAGLTMSYGPVLAVAGVDLELRAGQVTALMGRNGAGKSSLLWALTGVVASKGSIDVAGVDPRQADPDEVRRRVALVPQTATDLLYLDSVAQECEQADKESGVEPGTTARRLTQLGANLPPDRHPRDLSEGQRLSLVLAIQLAASPRVVLLDEPTRGLDYQMKAELAHMVQALADDGATVLISTHDVEFAAAASTRTLIMADGDIVADGPTRDICTSSPAYAPQAAKVFAPLAVLSADEVVVEPQVAP